MLFLSVMLFFSNCRYKIMMRRSPLEEGGGPSLGTADFVVELERRVGGQIAARPGAKDRSERPAGRAIDFAAMGKLSL